MAGRKRKSKASKARNSARRHHKNIVTGDSLPIDSTPPSSQPIRKLRRSGNVTIGDYCSQPMREMLETWRDNGTLELMAEGSRSAEESLKTMFKGMKESGALDALEESRRHSNDSLKGILEGLRDSGALAMLGESQRQNRQSMIKLFSTLNDSGTFERLRQDKEALNSTFSQLTGYELPLTTQQREVGIGEFLSGVAEVDDGKPFAESLKQINLFDFLSERMDRLGQDTGLRSATMRAAKLGLPLFLIPDEATLDIVSSATNYYDGAAKIFADHGVIADHCLKTMVAVQQEAASRGSSEKLEEMTNFALDAIKQLQAGYYIGSQATATNVLESSLVHLLGGAITQAAPEGFVEHMGQFGPAPYKVSSVMSSGIDFSEKNVGTFAKGLIFFGIKSIYSTRMDDSLEYNRHLTAHRVSEIQYTQENALVSVMHMTSVLVFLHYLANEDLDLGEKFRVGSTSADSVA